jgi:uncharacterized protein with HEPN domain
MWRRAHPVERSSLVDEILPAAVPHHPTVIGEAINRLLPELRERHPEVPWQQIVAVNSGRRTQPVII